MASRVRAELLPACQPSYSGYLAWRGICHSDKLSEGVQHLLVDRASMHKVGTGLMLPDRLLCACCTI